MNFKLTVIFLMLFALKPVFGQEQASNSVYQVGDTLYRAVDRLPSNPRLVHSNLRGFWDFTLLMAPYEKEIYIREARSELGNDDGETRCRLSNGEGVEYEIVIVQEEMWIGRMRLQQGNYSVEGVCDQFIPLRVNTSAVGIDSKYAGTVVFNFTTEMVAAMEDSELALVDSIRIVVNWNYHLSNDQKGQIQLESGLYDVVRQKKIKNVNTVAEIKKSGMWSTTNNELPIVLPTELQSGTTFSFWNEDFADPLAIVYTDQAENAVSVRFSVHKWSGRRIVQSAPSQPDIYVHPNPSFGIVRFDLVNLPMGRYELEIYNILGVRLKTYSLDVEGAMSYPLDLSELKKGTYIYRLVDSYHKTLRSKRLVIITP